MATTEAETLVPEEEFEHAKEMLHGLFALMGIQKVVVVDDKLSTPIEFEDICPIKPKEVISILYYYSPLKDEKYNSSVSLVYTHTKYTYSTGHYYTATTFCINIHRDGLQQLYISDYLFYSQYFCKNFQQQFLKN